MSLLTFLVTALVLASTSGRGMAYAAPQLVLLGTICVALNTIVDVVAVFAADRLLQSPAARAARARLLTRVSGVTMIGLGAYLAVARRQT
jgi:threonine/homoserine/homoserine lactone efflux protein